MTRVSALGSAPTVDRNIERFPEGAGTKAWVRFEEHYKERDQPGQRPGNGNVGGTFKA